jgi:hypothetical protein
MKMMVEYCQCVDDIPSAAPDLLTRLVDLLQEKIQNFGGGKRFHMYIFMRW